MKYTVIIPYAAFVTVHVEAENEEEAMEIAFDEGSVCGYCGNGGSDKLVGVSGDASIEINDDPLEVPPFSIEVHRSEE